MRLAALDYGTVTSRLLIADVDADGVHPVLRKSIITHLGEGLSQSGLISRAACERVVKATKVFLDEIEAVGFGRPSDPKESSEPTSMLPADTNTAVDETSGTIAGLTPDPSVVAIRAVATSAMRDASNRTMVIEALAELGIALEVIAGQREASLSFEGTLSGFDAELIEGSTVLVIDVGGGSTELVIGSVAQAGGEAEIFESVSFDIGARRVTDRFLTSDPPTAGEMSAARQWVSAQLSGWFAEVEGSGLSIDLPIAVAGTPTTLVAIRDGLAIYDPKHVHGQEITTGQLRRILNRLAALTVEERSGVVGLEPARAPVVVGGILVLDEVLKAIGADRVTVSETDILQGMILDTWRGL